MVGHRLGDTCRLAARRIGSCCIVASAPRSGNFILESRWFPAILPTSVLAHQPHIGGHLVKVDLHVHTLHSPDSLSSLNQIERIAIRRGVQVLAITDHNTLRGAALLARWSSLRIIQGEEITTSRGEIIGLFLREEIPPHLSPLETVRAIKRQGGLVCIPHPCDQVRRTSALTPRALDQVLPWVDIIEVLNARLTYRADIQAADELARRYHLVRSAGSDAHAPGEIGRAYVEMDDFDDAPSFLVSLAEGQLCGNLSSPLVHVSSTAARLQKQVARAGALYLKYRSNASS